MAYFRDVVLNLFLTLGIIFLLGCLIPPIIVIRWSMDTELPLSTLSGKFLRWDPARPNTAIVEWTGVRNRLCPGVIYRYVIGDQVWDLAENRLPYAGSLEAQTGKTVKWVVAVDLPPEARDSTLGEMKYRVTAEWRCNPLHQWWPLTLTTEDVVIPNPPHPAN